MSQPAVVVDGDQARRETAIHRLLRSRSRDVPPASEVAARENIEDIPSLTPETADAEDADDDAALNLTQLGWPPSDLTSFYNIAQREALKHMLVLCICVAFLSRMGHSLIWSTILVFVGLCRLRQRVDLIHHEFAFDVERRRGDIAKRPSTKGESVEWINRICEVVWPIISTDILKAGIDLLEDTMHAQAPSFVHSVRVDSIHMGQTPMRILSIKILPDDEGLHPDQSTIPDEPGDYVSMEVEFAFRRAPPPAPRSDNLHCVAYFGLGVRKVATAEMPVWIQLEGIYGRIRLRLQMIAEPPFPKPLHSMNVMSFPGASHFVNKSVEIVLAGFVAPASYTLDLSRILLGSDVVMKPRHIGILAICIHRAVDLRASDARGTSDPYVTISFGRFAKPLFSTRIVFKSLEPQWEEITFLRLSRDDVAEGETLRMMIWDSDRFSADDALGKTEVPLHELTRQPGQIELRNDELFPPYPGFKVRGALSWSVAFFGYDKQAQSSSYSTSNSTSALPTSLSNSAGKEIITGDFPVRSGLGLLSDYDQDSDDEISPAHKYGDRMRMALTGKLAPSRQNRSGILVIQIHQMGNLEIPNVRGQLGKHKGTGETLDEGNAPSTYAFVMVNDERVYETRIKKHASDPYINAWTERFVKDWTKARVDIVTMEERNREHDAIMGIVSFPLAKVFADKSHITRWCPIVGGVGYGRLRVSLLFKTIDIHIERPLRGWNVGVVEISRISIFGLKSEMHGELDIDIIPNSSKRRISTDIAVAEPMLRDGKYMTSTWSMGWVFPKQFQLPLTSRMQSAVSLRLRSIGPLGKHREVAGNYIWLSTIVDEEWSTIEVDLQTDDKVFAQRQKADVVPMPILKDHYKEGRRPSHKNWDSPVPRDFQQLSPTNVSSLNGSSPPMSKHIPYDSKTPSIDSMTTTDNQNCHRGHSHHHHLPHFHRHHHQIHQQTNPSNSTTPVVRQSIGDVYDTPRLRITLKFTPGLSQAHRHMVEGDRANDVWRAWKCMVNSGERQSTTPVVDNVKKTKNQTSPRVESSHFRSTSMDTSTNASSEWTEDDDHDDRPSTTAGVIPGEDTSSGVRPRLRWYRRHRRASAVKDSQVMYQRGTSQVKAVRTLRWMKDGVKGGTAKIKKIHKHKDVRVQEPELEGISRL